MLMILRKLIFTSIFIFCLAVAALLFFAGVVNEKPTLKTIIIVFFLSNVHFLPLLYVLIVKSCSIKANLIGLLLCPLSALTHYILAGISAHTDFFTTPTLLALELSMYLLIYKTLKGHLII